MESSDVIFKYKSELSFILDCSIGEIRFEISKDILNENQVLIRKEWVNLGDLYYEKPDYESICDFSNGDYRIMKNNQEVASFKLCQMPHCCAFIISCKSMVYRDFQNKGIGTLLNSFRLDIGKLLGYGAMLCTDIEDNTHQRKILSKNGWKDIFKIKNKRTENIVYLSVKNLLK